MSEKKPTSGTRIIETALEIAESPEVVWKALTDARELQRWFPIRARVEPGAGGSIWLSWGPPWEGDGRIEIWEPNRHLRTQWPFHAPNPEEGTAPTLLSVDYHLEGRGGKTLLRLVHSGFGPGAGFDDEYDGTRRGWQFELRSLRHYLEKHRGDDRTVALAAHRIPMPPSEAWARLSSRDGLAASGSMERLREGDSYALKFASGDEIRGAVLVCQPPTDFSGTVANLEESLFRVGIEKTGEAWEVWMWLSAYGAARSRAREVRERWSALLSRLIPEGAPVERGVTT